MRGTVAALALAVVASAGAAATAAELSTEAKLLTIVSHVGRRALESHARLQERHLAAPAGTEFINADLIKQVFGSSLPCLNEIGLGQPIDCLFDTVISRQLDENFDVLFDLAGTGADPDDLVNSGKEAFVAPPSDLLLEAINNPTGVNLTVCEGIYKNSSVPYLACMHLFNPAAIDASFKKIKEDPDLSTFPACEALKLVSVPTPSGPFPLGFSLQSSDEDASGNEDSGSEDSASDSQAQIDGLQDEVADLAKNLTGSDQVVDPVVVFGQLSERCNELSPGILNTFRVEQPQLPVTPSAGATFAPAASLMALFAALAVF